MRNTVVNRITELAGKDKKIFFVTGDAGFGVLDGFQKKFPRRFLNLGVAEQNMISFSAGLSLTGYRVFIYNIIPFLLFRCYEQVRNDICYQHLPVTLVGIGSGFTYAPQGVTHYSVEDIALARTLPNLVILSPADPIEAKKCAEFALYAKGPVYIRLAKTGEKRLHHKPVDIKKPIAMNDGKTVALLFHGSVSQEAVAAVSTFKANQPLLVSVPMLAPLDFGALKKILKNIHTVITVEEHYAEGGLGSIIAEWISRENLPLRIKKLGVRHEFIHQIKNNAGMRQHYGIDADSIRESIREAFKDA